MSKPFDARTLFEPWTPPARGDGYDSDEAELDAVRARTKGMSMFAGTVAQVSRPGFVEWLELAFDRELVVTLRRPRPTSRKRDQQSMEMFVARPEELWRVPAYLALWETAVTDGRWSDAAEDLSSHLLGYSAAERRRHLDRARAERPAWTAGTVYALLDASQRAAVESVGRRCFGPAAAVDGLRLFVAEGVLRRDALARVPKGLVLARAGLRWAEHRALFPATRRRRTPERTLDARTAATLNRGLVSSVQLLTRAGWR